MIINKNILNKILDKMALNKWKKQMNNINAQYHSFYSFNENLLRCGILVYRHSSDNCCLNCTNYTAYYPWVAAYGVFNISTKKCKKCGINYCIHRESPFIKYVGKN